MNRYIRVKEFEVRLVSQIDNVIEDEIVEDDKPNDMTFADEGNGLPEAEVPLVFEHLVVDLYCGLELAYFETLEHR